MCTYDGEWLHGVWSGQGVLLFDGEHSRYSGTFYKGYPSNGTLTLFNGVQYHGAFSHSNRGTPTGTGVLSVTPRWSYDGSFELGIPVGMGALSSNDGNWTLVGDFNSDPRGTYVTFSNGNI